MARRRRSRGGLGRIVAQGLKLKQALRLHASQVGSVFTC